MNATPIQMIRVGKMVLNGLLDRSYPLGSIAWRSQAQTVYEGMSSGLFDGIFADLMSEIVYG